MTGSRSMHWILSCLVAALAFAGCTGDTTSSETSGSLNLTLELAEGVTINEVDWTISGGDMAPMSGTIDTSAPGATASVEVFGLPPGDGYLVELEATDESGEITCAGSAEFSVEIGVATDVMVMLNCKRPNQLGGVRVNGKFNVCAELAKVVVSPLQTSVGNDISLSAQTVDVEGDEVTIVWSATGGSIADSNAADTTYTCGEVGDQSITVTVSDDDFVYCMHDWTVAVTCVEGEDLCEGVTCEDDGNDCTIEACNPETGQCESSAADDGTECEDGAGMCMDGECIVSDLCEGVDCSDDNECTDDVCNPEDGSCSNPPVDDGTSCNDGAGMCVNGACMDNDLCEGVTCDDTGNDCTVAECNNQTGECEVMNVPDGTDCNGGAGLCSNGECIAGNLCDGVDCTSANECVEDGTCDPATGECIPGGNAPVDSACTDGGTVCDGQGNCVECNSAAQCPDDGNQCTTATCDANVCGSENAMDGAVCDLVGTGDGVCDMGTCVEAPDCIDAADCDDGNVCTLETCDAGTCVFEPLSGGSCEVSAGVPGTCDAGSCVGLCEGVDCTSTSECVADGTCDDQTGSCIPGDDLPIDTACTEGSGSVCDGAGNCVECNSDNQCPGSEVCNNNVCEGGGVDLPAQSQVITVGCGNNVTADVSILPYELSVDPGVVAAGQAFTAELGGVAEFSETFLDAAQGAVVGGVRKAGLVDLVATVQTRGAGVTGDDVPLTAGSNLGYECWLFDTGPGVQDPCDPANDLASIPGARGNTDCLGIAVDPCVRIIEVPISEDQAECTSLNKAGQFDSNGFCVTGGLPIPLDAGTGSYTAGASGSQALFGWFDTPATDVSAVGNPPIEADDTYNMQAAAYTGVAGPVGLAVFAGLNVQLECLMAEDSGGPNGVGIPDDASPTPDDLLIEYIIP